MIVFGTRGVPRPRARGRFHCPACGPDRTYAHLRVRRWFTLYFTPVVPLDVLGEYVECQDCHGTFHVGVLAWDPAAETATFEAELYKAVRRTMVLMMQADGVIEDREVATLRDVYLKVTDRDLTDDEVRAEAAAPAEDLDRWLSSVMPLLNDNGRELVLKAAWYIAVADGELVPQERDLLEKVARILELSPERVDSVLGSLGD